jgi:hypothetical protein
MLASGALTLLVFFVLRPGGSRSVSLSNVFAAGLSLSLSQNCQCLQHLFAGFLLIWPNHQRMRLHYPLTHGVLLLSTQVQQLTREHSRGNHDPEVRQGLVGDVYSRGCSGDDGQWYVTSTTVGCCEKENGESIAKSITVWELVRGIVIIWVTHFLSVCEYHYVQKGGMKI